MASSGTPEIRRTSRLKKPSLKALESQYANKLKANGFVAPISSDDEDLPDFEDACFDTEIEKPKFLHGDDDVVHGDEIYAFQARKQRNSLALKISEVTNTPHVTRKKMKSKIAAKIMEEGSDSEYQASSSEDESSESDESSENTEESGSDDSGQKQNKPKLKVAVKSLQITSTKGKKSSSNGYTLNTEDFFTNHSSNKVKTSNNTLDKLETPRLPQYQLQKLLSNMKLTEEHGKCLKRLTDENKSTFKKWFYFLNNNFNVLLYGLGSKRNILKSFHLEYLKDLPVIVVNGFFPTLSIKNIVDSIISDLLELPEVPANLNEACDVIVKEFTESPENHLYLIVHNIEGETLRNAKSQNVLAKLAAVENIHLIASIDHINAPLIWDHKKLSKFNYIWFDVTSFLPYTEETSFEKSMMIQQTGSLTLSSLRNVFLSLTTNSKVIYLKIAKYQIENADQYYQGLAFKDLYMLCRESFIASSDLALRAQLTEFVDHKMVKLKRSSDGTEYLYIPIANTVLQKFLDENS